MAAAELEQLKMWRAQLKDAKKFIRKWVGKVSARAFVATYPVLRGHLKKDMEKDEVAEIIDGVDRLLRREGWLLLLTDSLIQIPVAKFMDKIRTLRYEETKAEADFRKARGKGTVKEANALRKLEKIKRKREHYEVVLIQLLLANPSYLRSIKKRKHWLSRDQQSFLQKFVQNITPRTIKERAWFNEMKKRLAAEK